MNISQIDSRVTFLTGLGTDIYLPAERLLSINKYYDQLHSLSWTAKMNGILMIVI